MRRLISRLIVAVLPSPTKKNFTDRLNNSALLLLKSIFFVFIILLVFFLILKLKAEYNRPQEIKLVVNEISEYIDINVPYKPINKLERKGYIIHDDILDSIKKLNNELDLKIKNVERAEIAVKDAESKNSDYFKIFLALIGSVFAIVGFFGFKSINDARDAALKNINSEMPKLALAEINTILPKLANNVAKETAITIAKEETIMYLSDKRNDVFRTIEETLNEKYEKRISSFEEKIDLIKNPQKYSVNERPEFYNDLIDDFEKLKNEFLAFKESRYRDLLIKEIVEILEKNKK